MDLEIGGAVVATARMRADGWWLVTTWPRYFTRNQSITALTITEPLAPTMHADWSLAWDHRRAAK